jgi:putative transposase
MDGRRRGGRQVLDERLTDLRNRGVRDVFFLVCDGLKGLPGVVEHVWPQAVVQRIIHLIRNTFRLASRADHDAIKRDLKAIYTAPTADAAEFALEEFEEKWGKKYRAIIRLWRNAWNEFIPLLDLRRRNSASDLQHQRHRKPQRPLPASRAGPRAFPHRAGGADSYGERNTFPRRCSCWADPRFHARCSGGSG